MVKLHGTDQAAYCAEGFGEMAFSRADFENGIVFADTAQAQDFANQLSSGEKILGMGEMFCIVPALG